MKLQKLTIHNIASIEDAVIDFEKQPLSDSEVFLITGQTGSGKSTILDAICLALYADTPRLNNTNMEGESQDNEGILKIKDPRQLLRRDAGEGWVRLTFIGNNRVHYQAEWQVQRAYKKVTGRMQGKQWKLQVLPDGPQLETDTEIKQEIAKAIELDFHQFCRTTLLAQGDFTRFLNSKDDEKAAILEKLTGMDVYAKIGQQVYKETGKKEKAWQDAHNRTNGISTLNDEQLAEKKDRLAHLKKESNEINSDQTQADNKKQWLETEEKFAKKVEKELEGYNEIKGSIETEEFKRREKIVQEWHDTIEARQYLNEKNKALEEEKKQQSILKGLKEKYATLQTELKNAKSQKEQAEKLVNDQNTAIEQKEKELENLHMAQLREQRDNAKELQRTIELARTLLQQLSDAQTKLRQTAKDLEKRRAKLAEMKVTADNQETPIRDAKDKMVEAKRLYEKQKDTVDKFASALRQKLQIGDVCPVCQQKINSALPHEEDLENLVKNLEKAYTDAEKEYNGLVDKKNKLDAEIKSEQNYINDAQSKYDNDDSVKNAETNALKQLKKCKIEAITEATSNQLNDLDEQQKNILEELGKKIDEGEKIEKDLRDKLRPELNRLSKLVSDKEKEFTNADKAIESNIQQQKFDKEKLESKRSLIEKNTKSLNTFLETYPEMNETKLAELDKFTSEEISGMRKYIDEKKGEVGKRKHAWESAKNNLQEHLTTKPLMTEEDTVENLEKLIDEKGRDFKERNQEIGAIKKELETDRENKDKLGKLIQEENLAKEEYDKWERLNQLIGNADGKIFRRIAQSYVLGSLIHSANSYMRTLTDRYTLKVVPGTFLILLEDAYQGYATRAASTISGGESFLVSLSLALALSDIGQKLSVNTLFIDEGFGTLSGEPLQNAITTLRTLHDKSGRHVGIISHIEELKERIPVQIQVNQESGSSRSTINIVPEILE